METQKGYVRETTPSGNSMHFSERFTDGSKRAMRSGTSYMGLILTHSESKLENGHTVRHLDNILGVDLSSLFPLRIGQQFSLAVRRIFFSGSNADRTLNVKIDAHVTGKEIVSLGECTYETLVIEMHYTNLDGSAVIDVRHNYAPSIRSILKTRHIVKATGKPEIERRRAFVRIALEGT